MTNSRKPNVYSEQKFMQQNETKESEAYCCDVNCYCGRQKQQETISKEDNDVNWVNRENTAINERLGFVEKQSGIICRRLTPLKHINKTSDTAMGCSNK